MWRFVEGFRTGWRALVASRLRAGLTMLGIVIGTGGVIGTMSFGEGARRLVLGEVEKMGGTSTFNVSRPYWVQRDGRWMPNPSREYLTVRDGDLIAELCPSVASVAPDLGMDVTVSAGGGGRSTSLHGTTNAYGRIRNWASEIGRFIMEPDVGLWNKVVVIGSEMARTLFGNLDPIGEEIRLNSVRYQVVGVMKSMGGGDSPAGSLDDQVFIPVTSAQTSLLGHRRVGQFLLRARSPDLVDQAQQEVRFVLSRQHGDSEFFRVYSQAGDMVREANIIGSAIKIVLGVIAAMSLVVGGIGIANVMLVSVAERIPEIGIRKAVGGTRLDIAVQFLMEALVLCLIGSAVGVLFGYLTERGLALAAARFIMQEGSASDWPSELSVVSVGISIGVGSLTGLIAGLMPALRAARLAPTEALRHQ